MSRVVIKNGGSMRLQTIFGIFLLIAAIVLGAMFYANMTEAEATTPQIHPITELEFNVYTGAFIEAQADGFVNINFRYESFNYDELIKAFESLEGTATELRVYPGMKPDGQFCNIIVPVDEKGIALAYFEKGNPCPPYCDTLKTLSMIGI